MKKRATHPYLRVNWCLSKEKKAKEKIRKKGYHNKKNVYSSSAEGDRL